MGVVLLEMGWTVAWLATGVPLFCDVRLKGFVVCGMKADAGTAEESLILLLVAGIDKDKESVDFRFSLYMYVSFIYANASMSTVCFGRFPEGNERADLINSGCYVLSRVGHRVRL
jgi:hypothetical protein